VAHVGERELLVVLDNCEHLVAACAHLAERLLTACPRLSILATSREPLHIAGEVDWRVPSLAASEAVRLFAERAGAASSRFDLAAVEAVCDGELDVLARLADKSLVVVEERDGAARYRLLDTVRHYARERLMQAGERAALKERHRAHYLQLAETLEPARL